MRETLLPLMWAQLLVLPVFITAKLVRPSILAADAPLFVDILFLSFPNFCEAIVGVITLTMIGYVLKEKLQPTLPDIAIYVGAVILAAVYVLTQELRIHNLGGNNVYDPYDMMASFLGLVSSLIALIVWKPLSRPQPSQNH